MELTGVGQLLFFQTVAERPTTQMRKYPLHYWQVLLAEPVLRETEAAALALFDRFHHGGTPEGRRLWQPSLLHGS